MRGWFSGAALTAVVLGTAGAAGAEAPKGASASETRPVVHVCERGNYAERMLKRMKLVTHAPSLAGVETLVSEPRLTSNKGIGTEGRTKIGIPDGFLRLSCGIEDPEDIIVDLEQALK
jgi:O-acetylhomoserine/O-acetylserine sulfhydrylase-like pyridoxal-dependent enzyme